MHSLIRNICIVSLLAVTAFAASPETNSSESAMPDRDKMKDEAGQLLKMDFSIPLVGISDPGMLFSHFSNENLLIYYFSPKCPHCQRHFPIFQKLIQQYKKDGFNGIGIAIGGSIKKNDIRLFAEHFHSAEPIFQDATRKFGRTYGTGYVPAAYLILKDGTIYRYGEINDDSIKNLRAKLDKLYAK